MSDEFTCARCGGMFTKGRSDEEAAAEAEQLFSPAELADTAVVCDDCWNEFMPHLPRLRAEVAAEASADPIGDALRADAEAARAELRAAGLVCPSCDVNIADVGHGHLLTISSGHRHEAGPGRTVLLTREPQVAKCATGEPVVLADATGKYTATWETVKAAFNVSLWDGMRAAEEQVFDELMYGGPAPELDVGALGLPPMEFTGEGP